MMSDQIVIQTDGNGKKIQKYLKKQVIGHGGFAKCYLMVKVRTGEKYAGKVIRRKQLKEKGSKEKILQEIQIHRSLSHDYIVEFHDMFEFEGEIFIIMELCQNNSLKEFLKKRVRLTEFEVKCYLLQIISAIQYLHRKGIVHRDIKLGNIFLNYKMQTKIGDFGLSTRLRNAREKRYTTCGTPNYIAPQILNEVGHSFEVDIWAIGIIVYALLIGKPPFQADTVDNTYRMIQENKFQFPKQIPLTTEAKYMIRRLLEPNPKHRIRLQEIKSHDFLTKDILSQIPKSMPPYTISIPPQNNYLKQFISEKNIRLEVYPRRISNTTEGLKSKPYEHLRTVRAESKVGYEKYIALNPNGNDNGSYFYPQKLNRVLSLDKEVFRSMAHHTLQKSEKGMSERSESKSTLNRCHIYDSRNRINTFLKNSQQLLSEHRHEKMNRKSSIRNNKAVVKLDSSEVPVTRIKHEQDTCEIVCYLDMTEKYGMGYLLSNGNYGMLFNDATSLTFLEQLEEEKQSQSFQASGDQRMAGFLQEGDQRTDRYVFYQPQKEHFFVEPPIKLKKKVEILQKCERKLQHFKKSSILIPFKSNTYVKKMIRTEDFFVLKLSNNILQFFWKADTVCLKGQKWIKWRISSLEGEGKLNSLTLSAEVREKVQQIKVFFKINRLKKESLNGLPL